MQYYVTNRLQQNEQKKEPIIAVLSSFLGFAYFMLLQKKRE